MVLPFTNIVLRFDRIWKYRFWGTEDLRLLETVTFYVIFSWSLLHFQAKLFETKDSRKRKILKLFLRLSRDI